MDYSKFTVKDFLTDDYFLRWVNQNDPEAEKFWNLFLTLHPETKSKIDQAREFALRLKQAEQTSFSENQVDEIWKSVQQRMEEPKIIPHKNKISHWLPYAVAASLIFAVFLIGSLYKFNENPGDSKKEFTVYSPPSTEDFIEEINTTQSTVRIHLNDGSVVNLAKDSRLKYRTSYEHEESRHVFLTGEAFFDVAKDSKRPFFVHANELITKVLGTSFRVKAYRNDSNVTVAVKSGKVSVFSPKNSSTTADDIQSEVSGVILLPNQQVVYQREEEIFDKTLVEEPVILSKKIHDADFTFENTPISAVFQVIQEAYGVEIIFDEDVMKGCFITAPLGSEPLFEKLKVICRTIGASYEIMDSKVVINSTGCR